MNSHDKKFRSLYEDNYVKLCRAANRILKEHDSAREVVQEVFVEFWNKEDWWKIESPAGYLYVSVYNRSLNVLKNRNRFVKEEFIPDSGVSDSDELQIQELQTIILQGITALPERCRLIFVLSREEELTYSNIASRLNLYIKTVEQQMGIALKKLRNHIQIKWK